MEITICSYTIGQYSSEALEVDTFEWSMLLIPSFYNQKLSSVVAGFLLGLHVTSWMSRARVI